MHQDEVTLFATTKMKVAFFGLLALFAFQGLADASPFELQPRACQSDDTLKSIIERIGNLITTLGETEIEAYKELINAVHQSINEFIGEIKEESEKTLEELQGEIKCLGNEINEVYGKVLECTKASVPEYEKAAKELVAKAKKCVEDEAIPAIPDVPKHFEECITETKKFIACKQNKKLCLNEGLSAINACKENIQSFGEVLQQLFKAISETVKCTKKPITDFQQEINNISKALVACAKESVQ